MYPLQRFLQADNLTSEALLCDSRLLSCCILTPLLYIIVVINCLQALVTLGGHRFCKIGLASMISESSLPQHLPVHQEFKLYKTSTATVGIHTILHKQALQVPILGSDNSGRRIFWD